MKKTVLMVAVLSFALTGFSALETVIKLNVSTAVSVRDISSSNGNYMIWNYSTNTALFNGSAAESTKVYGGFQHYSSNGTLAAGNQQISVSGGVGGANRLAINANVGSGGSRSTGVVFWDKNDFLAGNTDSDEVRFDASGSLSMFIPNVTDATDYRWVIRNGDVFYVSNAKLSADTTNILSGTDSVLWAEWDPSIDFTIIPSSGYTTSTLDFTDVTAIGIYFDASRPNAIGRFRIDGFVANLNVVPEPATLAMLGIGMAVVFGARKRFHR